MACFYWLQLASATACVALSGVRLARQDFGEAVDARTNRRSALDIFYGLALAEALLFLVEKAAWEWEVSHGRLLERVADECRLAGAPGLVAIRPFFYDAYSRCVEGSIFDGLRMDLVSFAEELIVGGSHDEQRIGVGILVNVAASPRLGDDALRRVGTSPAVVERLVEMLSWNGAAERGARASRSGKDTATQGCAGAIAGRDHGTGGIPGRLIEKEGRKERRQGIMGIGTAACSKP